VNDEDGGAKVPAPAFAMVGIASLLIGAGFMMSCATYRFAPGDRAAPGHHGDKRFRNIYETEERGFGDVLRWKFGGGPKEEPPIPHDRIPVYRPERVAPDLDRIAHGDPETIQVTWIGHSSFLIQVDGLNLLTDPVFSERISPVSFIGPRRYAPPGIPFESLPRIDAVLISHNHYDHLDRPTVRKLGDRPRYFVPLGLAAILARWGIHRVSELDWGQTSFIGSVLVHAVPAQHFSNRGFGDFDKTLWAGFVLETKSGNIYFAGDTGYAPHFKDIAKAFGPVRLAFLPIGAYWPRWFMSPMHMNPAEAVKAHQDLGAEDSVVMHWGTFKQADEPMAEPPIFLRTALEASGLSEDRVHIMAFGQTLVFRRR
jgi:N-acyl-phosphatidylethanolamine-hydrolysing phospholipase D